MDPTTEATPTIDAPETPVQSSSSADTVVDDVNRDDEALSAAFKAIEEGDVAGAQDSYDRIVSGKAEKVSAQPNRTQEPEKPTTASATPKAEVPATQQAQTPAVDEATVNLLKRFQMEPDDLPARPERRAKFLENLKQRAAYDDSLAPSLAELRRKLEGQGNGQQQAAQQQQGQQAQQQPQDEDAEWKTLTDVLGEELTKPLKSLLERKLKAQQESRPQEDSTPKPDPTLLLLEEEHTERGFADAAKLVPDGVDLSKDDARAKVIDEAWTLIHAEKQKLGEAFDLRKFNLKHAIPKAAQLVFSKEIRTAGQQERSTRRTQALRGTPDPGTTTPSVRGKRTEDELLDEATEAFFKEGPEAAERIYQGA